jgi:hypothetical protein
MVRQGRHGGRDARQEGKCTVTEEDTPEQMQA